MPVRIGPRFLDKVNLCLFWCGHLSRHCQTGRERVTTLARCARPTGAPRDACPILLPRAGCTAAVKVAEKAPHRWQEQGIGPRGKIKCSTAGPIYETNHLRKSKRPKIDSPNMPGTLTWSGASYFEFSKALVVDGPKAVGITPAGPALADKEALLLPEFCSILNPLANLDIQ